MYDITQIGSLYGRKLMKGFLLSKGFRISESKVASALRTVAPDDYEERRHDSLDRSNPVPYHACHFGHKIHLDQNKGWIFRKNSGLWSDAYKELYCNR